MRRYIIFFFIFSLFLGGCATVIGPITKKRYSSEEDLQYLQEVLEYARQQYLEKHSDLNPEIKRAILEGKIIKGMRREEVNASWGKPDVVYRTVTNNIVNEQWLYKDLDYTSLEQRYYYLNFKDNKLASWQY